MRLTKLILPIILLLLLTSCSRNIIVNIDGKTIPNYEYFMNNESNGMRVTFILVRYYEEQENEEETIVKSQYLDAFLLNRVAARETKELVLHVKVVNTKKARYALKIKIKPPAEEEILETIYDGRLSRKDFALRLPMSKPGEYKYSFKVNTAGKRDSFALPPVRYEVK
ncbi:MAG: hypothetical protein PVG39_04710 [Desulfobacteraceae bacterium]|jgi:hypothetical protein